MKLNNHVFFENVHWGKLAKKEVAPPFIPDLYSINFDKGFLNVPLHLAFNSKEDSMSKQKESAYVHQKKEAVSHKRTKTNFAKSVKVGESNK